MKEYMTKGDAQYAARPGTMCLFGFRSENRYYVISQAEHSPLVEAEETESEEE